MYFAHERINVYAYVKLNSSSFLIFHSPARSKWLHQGRSREVSYHHKLRILINNERESLLRLDDV